MKKPNRIEQEVDKTLGILDQIDRAETDAFFYSRLESRMEEVANESVSGWMILFPNWRYYALAMLLLLIFNVVSLFHYAYQYNQDVSQQQTTTSNVKAFANEYSTDLPILYPNQLNEEEN